VSEGRQDQKGKFRVIKAASLKFD